jgi:hypothetical protein
LNKFEPKDYALVSGQVVEILEIRLYIYGGKTDFKYKIKLLNDGLTHWIDEEILEKLPNQTTPKILFSNKN